MDDIDKPKEGAVPRERPNAKYGLSRRQVNEDELVFYYNRERRLAKAPQAVRDLYKEEPKRRFNLLKPLIGSRPRAMMFGSIVLICVAMLILSILGYTGDTCDLEGNRLFMQADRYEGMVMLTLKKTIQRNGLFRVDNVYTGAVDIAITPKAVLTEALPVFTHRIFFTLEDEEQYRFVLPFDTDELVLVFQTEKTSLSTTVTVE
jgi:hypothetical protein